MPSQTPKPPRRRHSIRIGIACCLLALNACAPNDNNQANEKKRQPDSKLQLFVANYPLQYFAERIGGEHVSARLLTPAEQDPAFWRPNESQLREIQAADLVLLNGAGYDNWINTVALSRRRVVVTARSAKSKWIKTESSTTHSHGDGSQHRHGDTAYTTWLDLDIAAKQASAICDALQRLRPKHRARFDEAFKSLNADLDQWDQAIRASTEKNKHKPILFSHPVYQYLQRRYGLNALSLQWEPSTQPTKEMWSQLENILQKHPAKWIIWESEPDSETRKKLESMGVQSVIFTPCANAPRKGSLATVMLENCEQIRRVYSD